MPQTTAAVRIQGHPRYAEGGQLAARITELHAYLTAATARFLALAREKVRVARALGTLQGGRARFRGNAAPWQAAGIGHRKRAASFRGNVIPPVPVTPPVAANDPVAWMRRHLPCKHLDARTGVMRWTGERIDWDLAVGHLFTYKRE